MPMNFLMYRTSVEYSLLLPVTAIRQQYSGRKNNCELRLPLDLDTLEGDRKTIAHREREHNHFLALYDVKQLGSGCRSIATEDSCE
jgi:hypothetical protein